MKRNFMTKKERLISEIIALHDQNVETILNKSDSANNLLLQSLFDRQLQEYIHSNYSIPIQVFDKYIYRLNSLFIHNPNDFDKYKSLPDKIRFISEKEYNRLPLVFKFLHTGIKNKN